MEEVNSAPTVDLTLFPNSFNDTHGTPLTNVAKASFYAESFDADNIDSTFDSITYEWYIDDELTQQ